MKDGEQDISSAVGAARLAGALALPLLAILLAVLVWWQFPKDRASDQAPVPSARVH
jgi:hypothetical protein